MNDLTEGARFLKALSYFFSMLQLKTIALIAIMSLAAIYIIPSTMAESQTDFQVARVVKAIYPETTEVREEFDITIIAEYEFELLVDICVIDVDRDIILDSYTMISSFTGPGQSNFSFRLEAPENAGPWRLRTSTRAWWANTWYSDPTQGSMDFEIEVQDGSTQHAEHELDLTITSNLQSVIIKLDETSFALHNGEATVKAKSGLHNLTAEPIVNVSPLERRVFVEWSDGNSAYKRTIYLKGDLTLNAVYKPQYRLTVEPNGGIISGDGWYWAGSKAYFAASPSATVNDERREFTEWTGDYTSSNQRGELTIDRPKHIIANWKPVRDDMQLRNLSLLFILATLSMSMMPLIYGTIHRRRRKATMVAVLCLFLLFTTSASSARASARASPVVTTVSLEDTVWRYWKNPESDTCIVWLGGGILKERLSINPFWLESYNTRRFMEDLASYYSILAVEEGPEQVFQSRINRAIHTITYRPNDVLQDAKKWLEQEGYRYIFLMGYSVGGMAALEEAIEGDPEGWNAPNGLILITVPIKSKFKNAASDLKSNILFLYGEKMTQFYIDSGVKLFDKVKPTADGIKELHILPLVAHEVWTIAEPGEYSRKSTYITINFIEKAKIKHFNNLELKGISKASLFIDEVRILEREDESEPLRIVGRAQSNLEGTFYIAIKSPAQEYLSLSVVRLGEQPKTFRLTIPLTQFKGDVIELHAYYFDGNGLEEVIDNPKAILNIESLETFKVRILTGMDRVTLYLDGEPQVARNGVVEFSAMAGTHNLTAPSLFQEGNTRFQFWSWGDGKTEESRQIDLYKDLDVELAYTRQHLVTVESPWSTVNGSGWYDEGSIATLSVSSPLIEAEEVGSKHLFSGWSVGGNATSKIFEVENPVKVTANWQTIRLVDSADVNLFLTVDLISILVLLFSIYYALHERKRSKSARNS